MVDLHQSSKNAKAARISAKGVRAALADANDAFGECWEVFADLKHGAKVRDTGPGIAGFQLRLLDSITALESVYRAIAREERRLIARKPRLQPEWFARRVARLADYKTTLQDALAVGRAIGDGFAWLFYERDRDLIVEHLKHPRQPLLPPRVGALGERVVVGGVQMLDGRLLLYHGTTTFLRLGDVSVIDLKSFRVVSLGELKTQQLGPTEYNTTLHLIALDRASLPRPNSGAKAKPASELAPHIKAKLKRQSRQIGDTLTKVRDLVPREVVGQESQFHFDALEEVVRRSHRKQFEFVRAGDGLVIGALRMSNGEGLPGLFRKLADPAAVTGDVVDWAKSIMTPDRDTNALIVGGLGSGSKNLVASADALPIAWWPVDREVLLDILFGNVTVMTLCNPGHLWFGLRERGFELVWGPRHTLAQAVRVEKDRRIELHHFDHYHRLVSHHLMTEASVMEMVDRMIAMGRERASEGPVRVEMRPVISRPPEAVYLSAARAERQRAANSGC